MGIDAVFGIELLGAALLGNYAIFQDHDLVGTGHGAHPVGNDQNGFVPDQPG